MDARGVERQVHTERRRLRAFGITVGCAFAALSLLLLWRGSRLWPYSGVIGVLLLLAGWLAPGILKPLERAWMLAAGIMGWVMTRVILGILFLLIFTPAGLLSRLLDRDPLEQRFPTSAPSYWHPRRQADRSARRMERMF